MSKYKAMEVAEQMSMRTDDYFYVVRKWGKGYSVISGRAFCGCEELIDFVFCRGELIAEGKNM